MPWPILGVAAAGVFLAAVSIFAIRIWQRHPFLLVGWLWFLVTLLPVIGLIRVGPQSMADRYAYVPMLGLLIAFALGLERFAACFHALLKSSWESLHRMAIGRLVPPHPCPLRQGEGTSWPAHRPVNLARLVEARRTLLLLPKGEGRGEGKDSVADPVASSGWRVVVAFEIAAIGLRAFGTFLQLSLWRDSETVFRQVVKVDPENVIAHNNLGEALLRKRRVQEAAEHFLIALTLDPSACASRINFADVLVQQGRFKEATNQYARALNAPKRAEFAHAGLAYCLVHLGQTHGAIAHYSAALSLKPTLVMANHNLASILATSTHVELRNVKKALELARRACELTEYGVSEFIGTLAAVYREAGMSSRASEMAERAANLALQKRNHTLAAGLGQQSTANHWTP